MRTTQWGRAALAIALLATACQQYKDARERETSLEDDTAGSGATTIDSAAMGTLVDTTGPLLADSAKHMDAGAVGTDTGAARGASVPGGTR